MGEPPPHRARRARRSGQAVMITKEDPPASGSTRVDQHWSAEAGQPDARNRPAETAQATSQTGTSTENLAAKAPAAALTAATASAHPDPAGPGSTGSGANARARRVNTTRTCSTRAAKRRNQPGTVVDGRPNCSAIPRWPTPVAFAANAAPITTTASARRSSSDTGSSTCVARHPVHRDRRGTTRSPPSRPRTVRARARPHPTSTPAHSGHANRPDRRRSSTPAESVSTVSIAPPSATTRPSRTLPAKDNSGRAVAYPDPKIVTVAAPTNPVNTTRPPACRSAGSTTPTSPYVVS